MKVAIIGSLAYSLINFRGVLIQRITSGGHEVVACAPDDNAAVTAALGAMGARFRIVQMARASLSPLSDLRTLCALVRLLYEEKPDIILAYTQKPIIYAGIASRIVRHGRFFPMVTGLGYAFSEDGRRKWLRSIVSSLYRLAIADASSVVLYNRDDHIELLRRGALQVNQNVTMVPGSGVDMTHFAEQPIPAGQPTFLLIARLLHDKGLREYVGAARIVRQSYAHAKFQLLGPFDANPASISVAELSQWEAEGCIEYLGQTEDVRPYLAACSVFVLPSYREGMPRAITEAMATGRAIITTDVPGCRDTVTNNENGFVVPVRNSEALAEAMIHFCRDPALALRLGKMSRQIALRRYAVEPVNELLLATMGLSKQPEGSIPADCIITDEPLPGRPTLD